MTYFTDYDVLSEEQALNLLPKGDYTSWIRDVAVKPGSKDPSKTYIVLTVDVYDKEGMPHSIFVWCYFPHMLRHACQAAGCLDKYESKTLILDQDLKGKEVIACVSQQKAKDGYPARNSVTDFKAVPKTSSAASDAFNDAVPF